MEQHTWDPLDLVAPRVSVLCSPRPRAERRMQKLVGIYYLEEHEIESRSQNPSEHCLEGPGAAALVQM